jgi:hypothetical protein
MKTKTFSDTGNRTPVSRVTGGDTSHYTMSDLVILYVQFTNINIVKVALQVR